jgi:hypothetical protein
MSAADFRNIGPTTEDPRSLLEDGREGSAVADFLPLFSVDAGFVLDHTQEAADYLPSVSEL